MQPSHSALSDRQHSRPTLTGKTILIADDDPTLLRALEARCRALGPKVETASDGLRTLLKVTKDKPDLLILDLNLPDVDGFRVVERLTDPKFPPLPVIALTGRSREASIQRCEELGVLFVHKDENMWNELESTIFKVFLEKSESEPLPSTEQAPVVKTPRILIVDDDPVVLKSMTSTLQMYDLELIHAPNGMQGYWLTLRMQPDLVMTDYNMEQGSGHYLLSRIKSTPSVQHIPVVIFTAEAISDGEQHAIRRDLRGRGQAAAFIAKRMSPSALVNEIARFIPLRKKN
jgi:CheY-like chemotaxis protein